MASKPHRAASAVALTELMLLASGCMAPMCRTSEIERGFTLSAELGPTAFRGIGVVHDTTGRVHTGIVDLTCIGAQADLRVALGFTRWLGVDLTEGFSYGWTLNRPDSLEFAVTWSSRTGAAVLFRPWRHNSLIFVEYQLPHLFTPGWVSGFPLHGPEQWSVMVQPGIVPFYAATHGSEPSWRDFVPEHLQLGLRRNFRVGRATLAPALGSTVAFNWDTFSPTLTSLTLSLLWSPPSLLLP